VSEREFHLLTLGRLLMQISCINMKFLLLLILALPAKALDVASLHPLMTDLIRQIGGQRVSLVEICRPNMDIHHFEPKPSDIREMSQAKLIFASGKGLEPYLTRLKDSLQPHQQIVEVGRSIPSQKVSAKDQIYICCPQHAKGAIDPHWWHNVRNMERAVKVIANELSKADPENQDDYSANARNVAAQLLELDRWVKARVSTIPRQQRHLVTSHAAFGYFCKAYGFRASFVQGLSAESEVSAAQLIETIQTLQKEKIPIVFPEVNANPKVLAQIAKQSGANVGKSLVADGSVESYRLMMTQNVESIVNGLTK